MFYKSLLAIKKDLDKIDTSKTRENIYREAISNRLNDSLSDYYRSLSRSSSYLYSLSEIQVAKNLMKER